MKHTTALTIIVIIFLCWALAVSFLLIYYTHIHPCSSTSITILEAAPNPNRGGYQISWIQGGTIHYYYPITETGKDTFLLYLKENQQ